MSARQPVSFGNISSFLPSPRWWGRAGLAALVVLVAACAACKNSHGRATPKAAPVRSATPAGGPSVGINTAGVAYWEQEWTFVDLVKRAKDWGEPPGGSFRVDANGWLTWMAPDTRRVILIGDADPAFRRNFPLGRYVVLYDGKGHVVVECGLCREISRSAGRVVVDVVESNHVRLVVDAITEGDPLRNLRMVPVEFEATHQKQPFHPKFLEALRSFAAIRHFGNQKTNGNKLVRWADRPKPTDAFQDTDHGLAVEYMIQLSNVTGTDAWFSLPPRVDDDYVRNFARLVFSQLDPDRKVYLEYGNEIWNESPPYGEDGKWMTQQARRLQIPMQPDDDGSEMTCRLRYQVFRSRQIFEIFKQEMKKAGIDQRRLVRVLASQAAFADRIRFTLDYKFPDGTFGYQHADALAVAPYFAGLWTDKESELAEHTWTIEQILDYADCSVSAPERAPEACAKMPHESVVKVIREDAEMARKRGLRLLGYEGGQHMVAWNGHPAYIDKLAQVNRAPRMKQIYAKYLDAWRDNGGELMLLLSYVQFYGRHGYWGMFERQDQPRAQAPKFDAVMEFMTRSPAWWTDPWPLNKAKAAAPAPDAGARDGALTGAAKAPPAAKPAATGKTSAGRDAGR